MACRYGTSANQLFTWRRLMAQRAFTTAIADEEVVPASDYHALDDQVREVRRSLGKKMLKAELLAEALEVAAGP